MLIRLAVESDLSDCVRLGDIPELHWGEGNALNAQDYRSKLGAGLFLVAVEDKELRGFVLAEPLLRGGVLLWLLAVAPAHRNEGIGSRLLDACEDRARAAGLRWVILYATQHDPRLIPYYRKRGYEIGQEVVECVKLLDSGEGLV